VEKPVVWVPYSTDWARLFAIVLLFAWSTQVRTGEGANTDGGGAGGIQAGGRGADGSPGDTRARKDPKRAPGILCEGGRGGGGCSFRKCPRETVAGGGEGSHGKPQ